MRDLLTRRYHYAEDDVPHRDLLDCLSEDGRLPGAADEPSDDHRGSA